MPDWIKVKGIWWNLGRIAKVEQCRVTSGDGVTIHWKDGMGATDTLHGAAATAFLAAMRDQGPDYDALDLPGPRLAESVEAIEIDLEGLDGDRSPERPWDGRDA